MTKNEQDSLKHQIQQSMGEMATEDLIKMWQKNDRLEWTDDTFDVVRELLLERLGSLPDQNIPIQIVKTNESIAQELLKDYERKREINYLVNIIWIICLFYAGLLFFALIFWAFPRSNQNFVFEGVWLSILFASLSIPVFFLRKKTLSLVGLSKQVILGQIEKSLGH